MISIKHQLLSLLLICSSLWAFAADYDFVVDQSGKGNFITVQEAIDAVPDFRQKETRIFIKNGVYNEKIVLAQSKRMVRFIGEDKFKTIITHADYAQKKNRFGEEMGTTGSSTFFLFADDFKAENISFENSAGAVGQAVAVRVVGDRVVFNNCRFLGNQDTLYPQNQESRQYYKNCYIEGTVDFIFGAAICVFDSCELVCKSGGYITAASSPTTNNYGFVFRHCQIKGEEGVAKNSVYLGRPWRPHAKVVFLQCAMGQIIKEEAWHNWGKAANEQTAFYAEYGSTGKGAKPKARVDWSQQLTDAQAESYSLVNIFSKETKTPAFEEDWLPKL